MTGLFWGLIAFDLDGEKAIEEWARMSRGICMPPTWVTYSGGGGQHIWFRLPANWTKPLPKAEIWRPTFPAPRVKGEAAIERLCDKSLVMFPPSIHPRTGVTYVFEHPLRKPPKMRWPAVAPAWVMALQPLKAPVVVPVVEPTVPLEPLQDRPGAFLDRDEVLSRIHDKVSLAASWGLRIAGRARDSGWLPCRAIDREDSRPSAAFHRESGIYTDRGSGRTLSLFDLMIAFGRATDFRDAKARLADQFC